MSENFMTYDNALEILDEYAKKINTTSNLSADVIAPQELTNTAVHAYAAGEQFIYNTKLYEATQYIAIGDTITVGTNCVLSDNIVDQIKDTANLTTTFTSSDDATEIGIIVASGETSMTALTSGDTHGGLFGGLSKVVLNTRKLINTVKRVWNSVGATWVSGHAYAVNDMVVYENGHVYKCKAAHTSRASILPTNTTYWTDTTLAAEICSLNNSYANMIKAYRFSKTINQLYSGISLSSLNVHHVYGVTIADNLSTSDNSRDFRKWISGYSFSNGTLKAYFSAYYQNDVIQSTSTMNAVSGYVLYD